jgi:hypothetical protein
LWVASPAEREVANGATREGGRERKLERPKPSSSIKLESVKP